jgi:hypothetical protein
VRLTSSIRSLTSRNRSSFLSFAPLMPLGGPCVHDLPLVVLFFNNGVTDSLLHDDLAGA